MCVMISSCNECEIDYSGEDQEIKRLLRMKACLRNICRMIDKRVAEKYGEEKNQHG